MQVPIIAPHGAGGEPQRAAGLLEIEENRILRTVAGTGQVGRNEIILGCGFEAG